MNNIRFFKKSASIFLLTILLILTSVDVIADIESTTPEVTIPGNEQIINIKNDDSIKNSVQSLRKHINFLIGWAEGNASSGKLIGFRDKIVKIKFNYFKIEGIRFFPIRWQMADFWNATAIIFNFNQTIPQGPFEMERDWVVAVVIN